MKKFSERALPNLDLEKLFFACDEVCALEALDENSTYSDEQQEMIRKLVHELGSCQDEDCVNPDKMAEYKEKIQGVTTWFKNFQPSFEKVNTDLCSWAMEARQADTCSLDSLSMAEFAAKFPPSVFKLPDDFDNELFLLQCSFAVFKAFDFDF